MISLDIETLRRDRELASLRVARAARYPEKQTAEELTVLKREYALAKMKFAIAEAAHDVSLSPDDRRVLRRFVLDLP